MKKEFLILLGLIIFVACDKVKQPIQNPDDPKWNPKKDTIPTCILVTPVVKTNTATSGFRKILIEDYTGHRCGNCPNAARKLELLETQYKDSLVGIAVHAGTQFAPPKSPDYPEDFRTSVGTDWDNFFGCSSLGLPKGIINRVAPYPQSSSAWSTLANTALHKPQSVKLDITTYFDVTANLLNIDLKAKFKTVNPNDVWISLVITEDSIRANQTEYNPVSTSCIFNGDVDSCYHFNHTLRASVNTNWGELLKAKPILVNDSVIKKVTCYKITNVNNTKKINLVAFAYDYISKEILQAEKIRLR